MASKLPQKFLTKNNFELLNNNSQFHITAHIKNK